MLMTENRYGINEGKEEYVENGGRRFGCYAIRTTVVSEEDLLEDIIDEFVMPILFREDIVFISEKMIACTEGRAYPVETINAGFFATVLSRFVTRSPYGIGLSMPETMQCAIEEAGLIRILAAAFVGGIGKLFHKKGWFYLVAGKRVAAIDGPCPYTLPPFDRCVVLAPESPERTAKRISRLLGGNTVLIIDANDLGCEILGMSNRLEDAAFYKTLLKQNPLGQGAQCTPVGILRPAGNGKGEPRP